DGVHQDKLVDEHGAGTRLAAEPQDIERVKGVGSHLYAGADLPELRSLLENAAAAALARESERCREAAESSAGNQDGQIAVRHGRALPPRGVSAIASAGRGAHARALLRSTRCASSSMNVRRRCAPGTASLRAAARATPARMAGRSLRPLGAR